MRAIWNLGIILTILTFLLSGTVKAQQQTSSSTTLVVETKFDFTHAYFTTGLGIAVVSKEGNPWFAVIRWFMSQAKSNFISFP